MDTPTPPTDQLQIPEGQRFMVCPLDWGLGHASRMIPIIHLLLRHQRQVVIAADGTALDLLQSEFPQLTIIRFLGVRITYSAGGSMAAAMLRQLPAIAKAIRTEHKQIKLLVKQYNIDTVISDNRFGLWCKSCRTVYVSHQLSVAMPPLLKWLGPVLYQIHKKIIEQYDICWVPDYADGRNLSGKLSHRHKLPVNALFINPLSRFNGTMEHSPTPPLKADIVVVLSGPEPQRSIFQAIVVRQLMRVGKSAVVVCGQPPSGRWWQEGGVWFTSHLDTAQMATALTNAQYVVCRSGYSSVMDLEALRLDAIMVPTPGQTEQIYLAGYLSRKKRFVSAKQKNFDLRKAMLQIDRLRAQSDV